MEKKSQVYVDPVYIKGSILKVYILWDWKTKIELQVEFKKKIRTMDRFKMIGFVTELMRRSNIDLVISKNDFINMQFGEFDGLNIKIINIDF